MFQVIKIEIHKDAEYILDVLKSNGFEGFVVGGCVRDSLLGKTPNDWDITTNATPLEIKSIFKKSSVECSVIPTGEKYGTITILLNGECYEITTYRDDGNYSDGRRPDKVTFSNNILEDLKRRDFTINAMAYNTSVGLIDPYGGLSDLRNGIISCVGCPTERFNEDALRIMRLVRFSSRYNFKIDFETGLSAKLLLDNLSNVSMERVLKELVEIFENYQKVDKPLLKLILSKIIPELDMCKGFEQHNPNHYTDVYTHTFDALDNCKVSDFDVMMSVLLHDIGKPHTFSIDENGVGHFYGHAEKSSEMARVILHRLKLPNKNIDTITKLVLHHDRQLNNSIKSVKRLLNVIGSENFEKLLEVKYADHSAQVYDKNKFMLLKEVKALHDYILANEECFTLKDLAINGRDIIDDLGITEGREIGRLLDIALDNVLDGKYANDKDVLLRLLKELI